jgi:endoglucanase
MKRLILPLIFLSSFYFPSAQPVKKYGALQVKGTALTGNKGDTVVLRGPSFGWHNFWPRFYNKAAVRWLARDWKGTVIRAAMGIEPAKGYLKNEQWSKEKIREMVDAALEAGLYVIVDWHSHNLQKAEAKAYFIEMAKAYGHYPNLIWEIVNEPDEESWDSVKAYATEIIGAIRAIDPDNVILVGTPHWDQDIHLAAASPLSGFTNIMYTMHFYAATHKQWLRDRCDDALQKGIPIFVSECAGMEASGNGPLNEKEWNEWVRWMEQRRISWVTWSVSDKDETCSMLLPSARSNGKWKKTDLKPWGKMVRTLLRDKRR